MSLPLRRDETREGGRPLGRSGYAEIMPTGLPRLPAPLSSRIPPIASFSSEAFATVLQGQGWDTPELLARAEACLRMLDDVYRQLDGADEEPLSGVEQLAQGLTRAQFFAARLLATRYTSPYGGEDCSFEEALATVADMARAARAAQGIAVCLGMSFWKRRRIAEMLSAGGRAPRFAKTAREAIDVAVKYKGAVAVWAARAPDDLVPLAKAAGVEIVLIEDGFVRSVGLGADFMPAASIVLDRDGIYFDPSRPSGLDRILSSTEFTAEITDRARRLIQLMVARGITKYNVGAATPDIAAPQGRRVIFVPGQVENDRSVALGGGEIQRNLDLLNRVRALNPDAYIVYKPHPDVDAGHRPGAIADAEVLRVADQVVRGISSAAIISAVDEVHTLTSLAGFEALIRYRYVVTYGRPFYAGWGLTKDFNPVPHRQRQLSLEQLVAGTLVLYPSYFDPVTRLPCGPEVVIERMSRPEVWRPGLLVTLRRLQGELMRLVQKWRPSVASNSR
jgi:capsular polysaccharide export protein